MSTETDTWTPLHHAARAGDLDTVRVLLEDGAEVDARAAGATPLHHAAYWGHPEVARELLACGADPKATDSAGYTPLKWAQERGHTEVQRVLYLALEALDAEV